LCARSFHRHNATKKLSTRAYPDVILTSGTIACPPVYCIAGRAAFGLFLHTGERIVNVRKVLLLSLLCTTTVVGTVAVPAIARPAVAIEINVAPPPPREEVVPPPRRGYVWAPGYWRWDGHQHVWAKGRWKKERPGSHWVAENWEERGGRHHFEPGHWARDEDRHEEHDRDRHR
jgi:hypothetical protein